MHCCSACVRDRSAFPSLVPRWRLGLPRHDSWPGQPSHTGGDEMKKRGWGIISASSPSRERKDVGDQTTWVFGSLKALRFALVRMLVPHTADSLVPAPRQCTNHVYHRKRIIIVSPHRECGCAPYVEKSLRYTNATCPNTAVLHMCIAMHRDP